MTKHLRKLIIVAVLASLLAAPVMAVGPSSGSTTSIEAGWQSVVSLIGGWITAALGSEEGFPNVDPNGSERFPNVDPNGSFAGVDPNGERFPHVDPNGDERFPGVDPNGGGFPHVDPNGATMSSIDEQFPHGDPNG